jgi:hypothetical protein
MIKSRAELSKESKEKKDNADKQSEEIEYTAEHS